MKKISIVAMLLLCSATFSQKLEFDGITMDFSKRGSLSVKYNTPESIEYIIYDSDNNQISEISGSGLHKMRCVESWPSESAKYVVVYIKGGKKETKEIILSWDKKKKKNRR